ncbi:ankyrin [Hyaloscypha variabilis]
MDPLSITASIAGLLAIAGTITSKGYACVSRVKNNGGDIEVMLNEVAGFSGILVGLKELYSAIDESPMPLHLLANGHDAIWQDSMKDCEKTLKELNDIVGSLASANVIHLMVKGGSMAVKVEKLVSKIERFKSFFVLCLQMQSNVDSREISRLTGEILGLLDRLLEGQESLRKQIEGKEESKKREKIIHWLGPTSEAVQEDIARGRDVHSSQWLLDRTEFLSWLSADGSANFWLWGIQGAGKTVIVSKVIETIQTHCLVEGDILLYQYCRFSDSMTLSSERVVGAMIAQILSKTSDGSPVPESLGNLFNRHRSSSYPSLKKLQQPFYELCQHHSQIYVIIDGLDEIIDRSGILEFLTELAFAGGSFKVFVASRPEFDLELAFESYLTVAITQSDVQADMETYVQQQLEKLQIRNDEETEQCVIVSELVERAQGMFLWAVCQIDHLSRIRTAITTDVLTALPQGLESTFEGVLSKLEGEDQHLALEILRVIMFSQRLLDLSEVVEAVAVTPKIQNLQQLRKKTLRRPADVFQLCGSLVCQSRSTGKISLAHYSVQEFLSRPLLEKGRQNQFFLQGMRSLQKQFETCISYLNLEDFISETFRETFQLAQDTRHIDSDLQVFTGTPFLDYASNYWAKHLENVGSKGMQLAWPLLENFLFSKRGSFESWVLVSQYNHGNYKFPNGARPIHVAVIYGLESLTMELLRIDPRYLDLQTSDGRAPLHIAIENNHEGVLDLLVRQGASLKTRDGTGRTPLHAAIESGSKLAVTQLVTAGADVNVVQSDGGTSISVAVENRWDQLASFLSRIADPEILLPDGRSLLHVAAQSGSLIWTTALLKFHEERLIDTQDENGWTPLHYAVDKGHTKVAQKLISSKCLVNVFDKSGWTPLHAAIRRRNLECASLILKAPVGRPSREIPRIAVASSSAGLSATGGESSSDGRRGNLPRPSMSAKYGEHFSSQHSPSELHGSAFGLRDSGEGSLQRSAYSLKRQQPSALHLAVADSYVDGVELLSKHADKLIFLGIDDNEKMKSLEIAVQSANIDLALILVKMVKKNELKPILLKLISLPSEAILEWVKAIFTVDEAYKDIIPMSIRLNEEGLVPIALQIWPNADDSLIHQALRNCILGNINSFEGKKHCNKLARILLDNGVPTSVIFMEQGKKSLLHNTIESQDVEFARFLIEKGANVDFENERGETPLLVLAGLAQPTQEQNSQQAWLDLACLLVSCGANTQALNQEGRGLCHKAVVAGSDKLLEYALHTLKLQPDLRDENTRTPLVLAVERGSSGAVRQLLKHLVLTEEPDDCTGPKRVIDAMEYANLRSSPLLRAMVNRVERKINIVTSIVEADEKAFGKLRHGQQIDLVGLRTSFYIEAICWTIDCNFPAGFAFLLPKISKLVLFSSMTFDQDSVFHSAARAVEDDYLKTLLQRLADHRDKENIIQVTDAKGKTPLDITVMNGSFEKTAILLRAGAKPTPLQLQLVKEKDNKVLEALLLRYSSTSSPEIA